MSSEYAVVDPTTGQRLKTYPRNTDDELRDAIGQADAAYKSRSGGAAVAERATLIRKVGELHVERRDELAAIIGREMGKPVAQALAEVDYTGRIYAYYADSAEGLTADEPIELRGGEGTAVVRRSAYGTLLGIMPWNFPYYQVARFAAPNLIIGNPILLKHAPQCPESAATIQEIFDAAGFPAGAYTNIRATNDQIEWVIGDPRVHGVSVTGSERAGAAVAAVAGRNLKKVVLELGGSDPLIVLGSEDIAATARMALAGRLRNAGQACNSPKRMIVIDELYDVFLAELREQVEPVSPGDPTSAATALGPLSSAAAAERLEEQVRRAIEAGATVVAGGSRDGSFFEPTILTGIEPGGEASQEEFFGPVAQIYRVGSEEEAISLANDTSFGLGSYVLTPDREQAERVADQLEVGMVFINVVGVAEPELPFGGVKRSGFGRELGRLGADEFVNKKLIRSA
ncbi:MAG: aldehyde dehydrogenase family protein [Solirubrobacterales bacterium]